MGIWNQVQLRWHNREVQGSDCYPGFYPSVMEVDNDTFAPVTKMVIVRTFLAVDAIRGWKLHQMDVNEFLHGELEEDNYMRIPEFIEKIWGTKSTSWGLK